MIKRAQRILIFFTALVLLITLFPAALAAEDDALLIESGKTRWHYYVTDQNGYAGMDADWYTEGYDVSSWKRGVSPFGDRLPGGTDSGWSGENHAIFLVTTFTLETLFENSDLVFEMFYDNTAKIYLNGRLIFQENGWNDKRETFVFSSEYLQLGKNTVAVSLLDDVGGREFDLSVKLGSLPSDATTQEVIPPPPEVDSSVLIDKATARWRYTVTTTEGFSKMDATWNTSAYDRSSWKTKVAPFGDVIDAGAAQETRWQGDNHGIFLVTSFTVDDLDAYRSLYYTMDIFYDNTLSVYLNGKLLVQYDGWSSEYDTISLPKAKVTAALVEGENLFAVSLLDDAGGREFSMSLLASEQDTSPAFVVTKEELERASLPILSINTDSGDYVTSRLEYVTATMAFDNMASYPMEDNIYTEAGGASIEIRGRGNSTWNNGYADGKPGTLAGDTHTRKVGYNIKLEEKVNFFGMGASKKWVLLANYMERSNMRNRLVADLSGRMGMIYTQSVYVNLVLNGEYMGIYVLTEKVDIDLFDGAVTDFEDFAEDFAKAIAKKYGYDKAWRSDMEDELCENLTWLTEDTYTAKNGAVYTVSDFVDLDGVSTKTGFLIEYDGYNDEPSFFHTAKGVPLKVSNLEYIKSNQEIYQGLKGYFNEFEEALFSDDFHNAKGKHYSEYVDMTSFVDYFILNTLILNVEFGYKSMYMSIGADGKIYLGPTWDYDWSSGNKFLGANGDYNKWYNDGRAGNNVWYREAYGDPFFVSLVRERWASLDTAIDDMIASMDVYEDYLKPSALLEYRKFSADPYERDFKSRTGSRSFTDEVAQLRTFLINRKNWLDTQFAKRDPNIEGFGFQSSGITARLSGEGATSGDGLFDYQASPFAQNAVLTLTLNAAKARIYVNGMLYREIKTSQSPYAESELTLSALDKGVNTVTVLAESASGAISARTYLTIEMPGEKQKAPTVGSFLPSLQDPGDDKIRLSSDAINAYVQLQDMPNGTVALRTVFVGDEAYLAQHDSLQIAMIFDTTAGKKQYEAALGKDLDYVLYQTVYANGTVFAAAEGDCLFGNEFHSIPSGILKSVTAIVTTGDGTLLYTGNAKLD